MAITPITAIDSPNVVVNGQVTTLTFSGSTSPFKQHDLDYILAERVSFTGSLINSNTTSTVGFGYGILAAPSSYDTSSFAYSASSVRDFKFYINGLYIDPKYIDGFYANAQNTQATLSLTLGYPVIDWDVISGVGRWDTSYNTQAYYQYYATNIGYPSRTLACTSLSGSVATQSLWAETDIADNITAFYYYDNSFVLRSYTGSNNYMAFALSGSAVTYNAFVGVNGSVTSVIGC